MSYWPIFGSHCAEQSPPPHPQPFSRKGRREQTTRQRVASPETTMAPARGEGSKQPGSVWHPQKQPWLPQGEKGANNPAACGIPRNNHGSRKGRREQTTRQRVASPETTMAPARGEGSKQPGSVWHPQKQPWLPQGEKGANNPAACGIPRNNHGSRKGRREQTTRQRVASPETTMAPARGEGSKQPGSVWHPQKQPWLPQGEKGANNPAACGIPRNNHGSRKGRREQTTRRRVASPETTMAPARGEGSKQPGRV